MTAPRLIEKRLPLSAVLGFIFLIIFIFGTASYYDTQIIGDEGLFGFTLFVSTLYIIFGILSYSLLSLANTTFCLLTKGGIHGDIVGVLGGVIFAFGVLIFMFTVYGPLLFETVDELNLTNLGIAFVATVVGFTLTVKG